MARLGALITILYIFTCTSMQCTSQVIPKNDTREHIKFKIMGLYSHSLEQIYEIKPGENGFIQIEVEDIPEQDNLPIKIFLRSNINKKEIREKIIDTIIKEKTTNNTYKIPINIKENHPHGQASIESHIQSASNALPIKIVSIADIEIKEARIHKIKIKRNGTLSLEAIIHNNGPQDTEKIIWKLYLSNDKKLSDNDIFINEGSWNRKIKRNKAIKIDNITTSISKIKSKNGFIIIKVIPHHHNHDPYTNNNIYIHSKEIIIDKTEINLKINKITINQGVQIDYTNGPPYSHPIIANRPGYLRVFLEESVSKQSKETIKDPIYAQIKCLQYNKKECDVKIPTMASSLSKRDNTHNTIKSINFILPSEWIQSNHYFMVDINPQKSIAESIYIDNHFPIKRDMQSFGAINSKKLNLIIIPIDLPLFKNTGIDKSTISNMTKVIRQLYPIPDSGSNNHNDKSNGIDLIVRKSIKYQDITNIKDGNLPIDNWIDILEWLGTIHYIEESHKKIRNNNYYYGVINLESKIGNVGLAFRPSNTMVSSREMTAIGIPDGRTIAHEIGHNHSLRHVSTKMNNCFITFRNGEHEFPYPNGNIGKPGWDIINHTSYNKESISDFMSYCLSFWQSDFNWRKIHKWNNEILHDDKNQYDKKTSKEGFIISGSTDKNGAPRISMIMKNTENTIYNNQGLWEISLKNKQGSIIQKQNFQPQSLDHTERKIFSVNFPIQKEQMDKIINFDEIVIKSPDGREYQEKRIPWSPKRPETITNNKSSITINFPKWPKNQNRNKQIIIKREYNNYEEALLHPQSSQPQVYAYNTKATNQITVPQKAHTMIIDIHYTVGLNIFNKKYISDKEKGIIQINKNTTTRTAKKINNIDITDNKMQSNIHLSS